jgi:tRNA uridine 5-carboxymethylaminomethyl modification enzyme
LFTSRSEFRLLLRQDNALRRLVPLAQRLGLLSAAELGAAERRLAEEERLLDVAGRTTITPSAAAQVPGLGGGALVEPERVASLARRPGVALRGLLEAAGVEVPADDAVVASAEIELKYAGYLAREREAAGRLAELAAFVLPAELPYLELRTLATEARQKLDHIRPTSLAQAARIPGVTPSDLHNLVVETTRWRRRVA